jgi:hypothetical protein
MLNVDYVMIKELTKFKWTRAWLNIFLIDILGKINQSNKKWLRYTWTFENKIQMWSFKSP